MTYILINVYGDIIFNHTIKRSLQALNKSFTKTFLNLIDSIICFSVLTFGLTSYSNSFLPGKSFCSGHHSCFFINDEKNSIHIIRMQLMQISIEKITNFVNFLWNFNQKQRVTKIHTTITQNKLHQQFI